MRAVLLFCLIALRREHGRGGASASHEEPTGTGRSLHVKLFYLIPYSLTPERRWFNKAGPVERDSSRMEESSLAPHLRAAAEQQREIESLQRELEATVSRADNLRDERASTIHTIAALAVADADEEDEDNAALLGSARGGSRRGYGTEIRLSSQMGFTQSCCRKCRRWQRTSPCSEDRALCTFLRSPERRAACAAFVLLVLCLLWRVLLWEEEQAASTPENPGSIIADGGNRNATQRHSANVTMNLQPSNPPL